MQIVLQQILDDPKLEYALILEDVPQLVSKAIAELLNPPLLPLIDS